MLPVITLDPIQIDLQHGKDSDSTSCLTLHPVIVEFDRLLRRKQQLEANEQAGRVGSMFNHTASSGRDGGQPKAKHPLLWSSSVLEDCSDVQDLLLATIIHYYATTKKVPNQENLMLKFETNTLNSIYRLLCTPGVKTLLLIAEKQEIFQHLKQSFEAKTSGGDDENGEFPGNKITEPHADSMDSSSLTINTATSEDCLTKDVFDDEDDDDLQDQLSSDCFNQFKPSQHQNHSKRMVKIQMIFDGKFDSKPKEKRLVKDRCPRTSARTRKFFRSFDKCLNEALDRAQKLKHKLIDHQDDGQDPVVMDLIGMEQQMVGAVTFHKSYRLESVKIIELELLAIQNRFQRLGIGSRLIKCLKENNQIGPYDSMHVQIPMDDYGLQEFFRKNNFSDDQILNAGFEQLKIGSSENQSLTDDDDDEDEDEDDGDDENLAKAEINHQKSINHYGTFHKTRPTKLMANPTISMCYLPPYSVGTLSETMTNHFGLDRLDHKFVDDIIDQANMAWQRDFLSAYRTQWSCVARLRAEIIKLRQQLLQRDSSLEQLKRENFQLRNALVLNRTSSSNSGSNNSTIATHLQHLNMYKNFRFDSLDF